VEKTSPPPLCIHRRGKHLHVRGENVRRRRMYVDKEETPPRAWRKRLPLFIDGLDYRNTSTCVEKTA